MNENTRILINLGIAAVLIFAVYKILRQTGLINSAEDEKNESDFNASASFLPFKILFKYKQNTGISTADFNAWAANKIGHPVDYDGLITQILGAKRLVNDAESDIFAAFKQLENLQDLQLLSEKWTDYVNDNQTSVRLWYFEDPKQIQTIGQYLATFLDPADYTTLKGILGKLKNYKK